MCSFQGYQLSLRYLEEDKCLTLPRYCTGKPLDSHSGGPGLSILIPVSQNRIHIVKVPCYTALMNMRTCVGMWMEKDRRGVWLIHARMCLALVAQAGEGPAQQSTARGRGFREIVSGGAEARGDRVPRERRDCDTSRAEAPASLVSRPPAVITTEMLIRRRSRGVRSYRAVVPTVAASSVGRTYLLPCRACATYYIDATKVNRVPLVSGSQYGKDPRKGNRTARYIQRGTQSPTLSKRGRGGLVVRLLASHLGEPGLIPGFSHWESCRTMLLDGGFSRGSSIYPAVLAFRRCSIFTSFHPYRLSILATLYLTDADSSDETCTRGLGDGRTYDGRTDDGRTRRTVVNPSILTSLRPRRLSRPRCQERPKFLRTTREEKRTAGFTQGYSRNSSTSTVLRTRSLVTAVSCGPFPEREFTQGDNKFAPR
ncbi:hypothetical protein PR048_004663 [Dryococelus australis]|uniref:Uncharacterized protein n=1 Tax=Dryococelus australis TaxID=614101 RepID=A0ABQ9I628_9NEOP|nr:hypothetical protein PR048_004663 [Dryococelus australis]